MTETVALLKPDVVAAGKAREVMQLIELEGFTILEKKQLKLSTQTAQAFYSEHNGKPFFADLVSFMTSGPLWALLLTADDAVAKWRELMGPTDTAKAREHAPYSLRALYGTDGTRNATHGSDSEAAVRREARFFFPQHTAALTPDGLTSEALCGQLEATLCKGLTALAREKPAHDSTGALTWLADWLLQHNPNKPRAVGAGDLALTDLDDEGDFRAAIDRENALKQQVFDEAAIKVGEKRRAAAVAAAAPAAEPDARVPTGAQSQASGRPSLSDVREDDAAAAREPALAAGGDDEVPVIFAHPGDGSAAQEEAAAAASTVQAAVRERLSAAEAAAAAADEGGDSKAAKQPDEAGAGTVGGVEPTDAAAEPSAAAVTAPQDASATEQDMALASSTAADTFDAAVAAPQDASATEPGTERASGTAAAETFDDALAAPQDAPATDPGTERMSGAVDADGQAAEDLETAEPRGDVAESLPAADDAGDAPALSAEAGQDADV